MQVPRVLSTPIFFSNWESGSVADFSSPKPSVQLSPEPAHLNGL